MSGILSGPWPAISADALRAVREPPPWLADPGPRLPLARATSAVRAALHATCRDDWQPPAWLLPHQTAAARRLAAALDIFGGALLADAVGLGKSYVALALATRYPNLTLVVPAALRTQWTTLAANRGIHVRLVTHEALSRQVRVPPAALLVVDEAHRFRNPATRRYDRLARDIRAARVLLVSATPVVNTTADLIHLLRLFLADHALAPFGVPSLLAAGGAPPAVLAHAAALLTVARTAQSCGVASSIPVSRDGDVARPATVPASRLPGIVEAVRALEIPPLNEPARMLVQRHLLLRLASSGEAFTASLHRHRRYLEHAARAAARGEPLERGAFRTLFQEDDAQLSLSLESRTTQPLDSGRLEAELDRLAMLRAIMPGNGDEKRATLIRVLAGREGRKTIVFTIARDTAFALARALGWRRVAVATATGGRIASGPLPLHEVLARFAPTAQRGPAPAAHLEIDTLIATDLASEGLNLQDADAVVHYDLPWNPLRLAQRVGRIARLGSAHTRVAVAWFAPPEPIEAALQMTAIIERKARLQLALAVPATSAVGRDRLLGSMLTDREGLAGDAGPVTGGHAVARGGHQALCVLRYGTGGPDLFEVVRADGSPARGDDWTILDADASPAPLAGSLRPALARLVRARKSAVLDPPLARPARALMRALASVARHAARARNRRLLVACDMALERLRAGVAAGAELELADLLRRPHHDALKRWIEDSPARVPRLSGPSLHLVLSGDGEASDPSHEWSLGVSDHA